MAQRTIKIIEAYYDEKRDLVQWLIEDIATRRHLVLCWPGRKDLGPAVGINAELEPNDIRFFCDQIEGKTINLVAEVDVKELDAKKFKNMSEQDLSDAHLVFDKYPYHEVLESLKEVGQFVDANESTPQSKYFSFFDHIKRGKSEN